MIINMSNQKKIKKNILSWFLKEGELIFFE
jgi:hypothetical protein